MKRLLSALLAVLLAFNNVYAAQQIVVTVQDTTTGVVAVTVPGPQGAQGPGVPAGGSPNQILTKSGYGNYSTAWTDLGNVTIPPATSTSLGGIKVGSGLAVTSDGTLNNTGVAGVASFNGRGGAVTPASGDYSIGQINGAATVASTGSYNDLSNKPTIPAAQVNSDWNASSGVAQVLNKPTIPSTLAQLTGDTTHRVVTDTQITSWNSNSSPVQSVFGRTGTVTAQPGDYTAAMVGADALGSATSVQTNLNATNTAFANYTGIDRETVVHAAATYAAKTSLATVATSGSYTDLINKPSLSTVAVSGQYSDLSGKPTLGTAAAANIGTTSGTVAAGDDSRIVNALQPTGSGAGLTDTFPSARNIHDKITETVSVMDYGAKGDVKVFFDGAVSSGSTSFTSATANFSSTDTGKVLIVHGAGPNDLMLQTTITYVNSTTVTLGTAASTSISGKEFAFGTDDTAAIQSAVNALSYYQTPESNPRIYGAHPVTALAFPMGHGFMTSGTITISKKSDAVLTGVGTVFFGDYTLFDIRGSHNIFAEGMTIEGMQYNHMITAPTTSLAFRFRTASDGTTSTHNGVQWCSIKRVKEAVLADSGAGYETLVDWNQFQAYNVLNSIATDIGTTDSSLTHNIINGFQTGSNINGVVTMVTHNHWWDNNAKTATGTVTSGSATITGIADTSVWIVGDYVTVSAGFPSSTAFYKILSKVTNTSITLDTSATSSVSATVSTAGILYNLTLGGNSGGSTIAHNEFDNCVNANVKIVPNSSNPWAGNLTLNDNFYQRSKWSQPFISFEPTSSTGLVNISVKGEKFFATANTGISPIAYNGNVNHSADSNYLVEDNQYYGVSADTYENKRWSAKADLTAGVVSSSQLPTASTTVPGVVKVDGTTVTISGGVISASGGGGGTVTSVTGTAPIASSGGATPAISIAKADATHDGYLAQGDWSTFNGKGTGTVTSVAAGTGLGGGTITGSGTLTNNLSTGVSGGQTATGGTASGDSLNLSSTSNGTKGYINFEGMMHYDSTQGRLLLTRNSTISMSATTQSKLQIIGENTDGYDDAGFFQDMYSTTAAFSSQNFRRARGTFASSSKVLSGDRLGGVGARGWYGTTGFPSGGTATIFFDTDEDFNDSTHLGTHISFNTTPKASGTRAEAMRVNASGNVSIGNTNDTYKLDVTGNANVSGTITSGGSTVATTVASGTASLGTSAISSGTCAAAVTATATGVATTDVVDWGFNGDPTGITGYTPSTSGMLTIIAYPASGSVGFRVCNNTAASITPAAVTLNWKVRK